MVITVQNGRVGEIEPHENAHPISVHDTQIITVHIITSIEMSTTLISDYG